MEEITSIKNDKVKYLRKLYQKKYRKERQQFILEGLRLIRGAYKAGADLENIFLTSDYFNQHKSESFLIYNEDKLTFVSDSIISEVADTTNPQEVIAIVNEPHTTEQEVLEKDYILVIDQIQDPGNMGTMIRTAAAAGFQSLIISKGSVDVFNLKVLRSTVGAIYSIPFIKDIELDELRDLLQSKEQKIYAADLNTDTYYNELKYKSPLSLIIGNEGKGIRKELTTIADKLVKIPLKGNIDSLNAGVAAGIIMFKILEN
ncbi:MAG TPA: RNA methyltransferase [Halanaerobiales bacterium]|nr:RNA methyltransferase [Halanaerobiales bacterium]